MEISIRTALGAHPKSVVATIARRALLQLSIGAAFGILIGTLLLVNLVADPGIRPMSSLSYSPPGRAEWSSWGCSLVCHQRYLNPESFGD